MGGNIYPVTSPVVGIPGQPTSTNTNNVSSVGLTPGTSWWDSIGGDSNWFGGQKHGTNYVDPTTGQLMTSSFGPDSAAGLQATNAYNKLPENKDNQITFNANADQGGWGGMLDSATKLGALGFGIWDGIQANDRAERSLEHNISLGNDQFNAGATSYNALADRSDAINNAKNDRASQLTGRPNTYVNKERVAKRGN